MNSVQAKMMGVHALLHSLLREAPDPTFTPSILYAVLGKLTTDLPDQFWNEAMESAGKPCGVQGCQCEEIRTLLMKALNGVRDDAKREFDRAAHQKGFAA